MAGEAAVPMEKKYLTFYKHPNSKGANKVYMAYS